MSTATDRRRQLRIVHSDDLSTADVIEPDHRRWDPWKHLRSHFPHFDVDWSESQDDLGVIFFDEDRIVLKSDLTPLDEVATLTHELIHAERGAVLDVHEDIEEGVVEVLTAARLIPVDRIPTLIADLRTAGRASVLAADVGVCLDTLYAGLALSVAVQIMQEYTVDKESSAMDVIATVANRLFAATATAQAGDLDRAGR